jgi:hypothetical protein
LKLQLEHEVRLTVEEEHSRLYSWSLQEFTSAGKPVGRKLIPRDTTLYFSAVDAEVRYKIGVRHEEGASDPCTDGPQEDIIVQLRPGIIRDGKLDSSVIYSILGSGRPLRNMRLFIQRLGTDGDVEKCEVWASAGYTFELDFEQCSQEDILEFYVSIHPRKYDHLRNEISSGRGIELEVAVRDVSGFYSEWSPSFRADFIKVLPNDEKHVTVPPSVGDISPPRVGKVWSFELTLSHKHAFAQELP